MDLSMMDVGLMCDAKLQISRNRPI